MLRIFSEIEEQKRIADVMSRLKDFGEWVKWESAVRLDKEWLDANEQADKQLIEVESDQPGVNGYFIKDATEKWAKQMTCGATGASLSLNRF